MSNQPESQNQNDRNDSSAREGSENPSNRSRNRQSSQHRRNRRKRDRKESSQQEDASGQSENQINGKAEADERTPTPKKPAIMASSSSSSGLPATSAGPSSPKFNQEDLKCVVCMDFPSGHIYQCQNGHLLCTDCHHRVVESPKCVCPSCRVKLSRDSPSRNIFAETVLSTVVVPCTNPGCSEKLPFGKLQEHTDRLCGFRPAVCKFKPIGCDWSGIFSKCADHESSCEIRKMSAKKILKLVTEREQKRKSTGGNKDMLKDGKEQITKLLSSRARDIVIRDVLLEKDDLCDEICSKTFMALGFAWEVVLTKDKATKRPSVNIRLVSSLRRKLNLTFFILKGPYVNFDIPPSVHSADFKKKDRHQNCHCVLPTDEETSRQLLDQESLHLRIGFVDRSRGVSRWFSNQHQPTGSSDSESSDTDGDYGDDYEDDESVDDEGYSYSDDSDSYALSVIEEDLPSDVDEVEYFY